MMLWALATVIVLEAGGGVVAMVAVNIPVTLLMRVVCVRLIPPAHRSCLRLPWRQPGLHATACRVRRWSRACQISDLLQRKSDELIVALSLSVAAVTPYALGRRLSELPHLVANQFVRVLLPIAAELSAQEEIDRLRTLYIVATRVTVAIFTSIGLGVVLLAEQILIVWVHPGYEDAVPVVVILTMASYLVTSQWPAGADRAGDGTIPAGCASSVASGIANVALSISSSRDWA